MGMSQNSENVDVMWNNLLKVGKIWMFQVLRLWFIGYLLLLEEMLGPMFLMIN